MLGKAKPRSRKRKRIEAGPNHKIRTTNSDVSVERGSVAQQWLSLAYTGTTTYIVTS